MRCLECVGSGIVSDGEYCSRPCEECKGSGIRNISKDERYQSASKYLGIGQEIGMLVSAKQAAYGDSFGRAGNVLRELFPDGIRPDQYDEVLTVARVLDKLFRIATSKDAYGESPWRDIAGYAILSVARDKK